MALQIKNNGPDDEPAREYYGSSWTESTTAREPKEEDGDLPEFNPEAEFDTFKVPKGEERKAEEHTSYMDPNYHNPNSTKADDKTSQKLVKTLITLAVVGIILILVKIYIFPSPKDISEFTGKTEQEIADGLGIEFVRDEAMDRYIPQWTDGVKVEAKSGKGLTVYSFDGQYKGFHIDNKKWAVYGINVGMPYNEVPNKITFPKTDVFMVLNDLLGGTSSADYYYNAMTNECLVVTINDNSGRVVAITYCNDFSTMTKNLSFGN